MSPEVELLLESLVANDLSLTATLAVKLSGRENLRDHDRVRQPEAEMVGRLKLVVHHRHRPVSERSGCENLSVGAMREREAWAGGPRIRAELLARRTMVAPFSSRPAGLGRRSADSSLSERRHRQLERLCVVADRQRYLVPVVGAAVRRLARTSRRVASSRDRSRQRLTAGRRRLRQAGERGTMALRSSG